MTETRRIMISLPQSLLTEIDLMVKAEHRNRSELIRTAMRFYLLVKQRRQLAVQMQEGYQAMGSLNLALAEENYSGETDFLAEYEDWLQQLETEENHAGLEG